MPNIQISGESFKRINVLGDGSCLFWAAALAYLTPVRDNNDLFKERFKRLFSSNDQQEVLLVQGLIQNHNLFLSDVWHSPLFNDRILTRLVIEEFRRKVVHEMRSRRDELIESITIQDLLHSRNIDYVVKGRFQENFLSMFRAEINQCNINLNKLKPNIELGIFDGNRDDVEEKINNAANIIGDELNKLPDQIKVKQFKFDVYLECMCSPEAWGGNHEIQAITSLLQCEIVTSPNQVRHSTVGVEYNDQIQLFNEGELHYNFGLVKAEVLIDAINNNEWNKVKGYLALGIDNINYQDNEERTAFDLIQHGDDAEIDQLLSNQGAKPTSALIGVDTSGSRSVDAVSTKNAVGAPQDFELIELLIKEMDPIVGSDASTSTRIKEDFESFQARFQSYIDQIFSYLHSVGKPGFFSHFFMGSFSILLDTEIAGKLNIKKIYFSFDTSLTLKVVVVKNGPIESTQDAINNIYLFSISEGKRGHQFTSGELEEILRRNIDKIKDVENKIQKIKDEIQDKIKSRLVKISKGKDGIFVTVEAKEIATHLTATSHEFHEMKKGIWNNPESNIAGLTSSREVVFENSLEIIIGKISEIHSVYENENLFRYSKAAREAAHHGFMAGALNDFRYRYNLRVGLEQFQGRGYADIVLLARGVERSLEAIPIFMELKAATSEELKELKKLKDSKNKKKKLEKIEKNSRTTPAVALEQAVIYGRGHQLNVQRLLTKADKFSCVGVNMDYPSPISKIELLDRKRKVIPLFEDILESIDEWSVEGIGKRGLKKQIKVNVERIYHTFPGTTEKGGNHYFSRFLLGQLLLFNEALETNYEKYLFIYSDNIPTETRPRPLRSSKRLAGRIIPTNLDESHAVVSMVFIPGDTEKLVYVINIVEINRKREKENDVLNKVLPLNRLNKKIENRKIVEFDLDFDTRYKSNFERYLTARAHKPASLEEYNNRNEAFQGKFEFISYPEKLKEAFDSALESQLTSSQSSSIDKYNGLFEKIGEAIWPFRRLIGDEAHFQGVLNGVFSYYSDLRLQESPETRALILTEFQTGRGKRIDMLIHGLKFEGDGANAKEYVPIGLELKASRQDKGGSAKALLEAANTQINDEYKKGVTYKTLTDGDKVQFIGVVLNQAAKDGKSLILLSRTKEQGFYLAKVVHSSTLVLPTVDKQDLSGCLEQGRKKRSTSRCLFSWDDIDRFNNAENVDKRNRDKIKIDNEKFLTYIKNSQDESKNAQLVDFIGEKITPNIEGNYKYLLNKVVRDGGYVNYDQNKRIKDLQNDVLQQDGSLIKNLKLKSKLINAAGRIQLIRGIHGAIVSCKDGTATDCGLNLGGMAWSFASQPIENVLVKITPKLVRQAESVAGKVLGKQTKFVIRVLGVKFGTTIARGTAGAFAGVFDLVDIGISASNLVACKNRESTDDPCGEKEIRDSIASISFSSVSFVSGIALTAANMPAVGTTVGVVLMVGYGVYSGVSNIIEYEKKYDTTHSENWSIFWRSLLLQPMSQDIQALEIRSSLVNSVAQEAWEALNNSSDEVVAYAMGFGNMDIKDVYFYCRKNLPKVLEMQVNNQFVKIDCSKEYLGRKVPIKTAEYASIFMNKSSNAYAENLSRVLPAPIQDAEMICLPQRTSGIYEKEGTTKVVSSAVYYCENAIVTTDNKRKQNGTTIIYDLRYVNDGLIIGNSELNNYFIVFEGKESLAIIGGNNTINRFVFTKSNFLGKVDPGQNSINIFDFSHIKDDVQETNISEKVDYDAISIYHPSDIKDDILEVQINYQQNRIAMQGPREMNVLKITINDHPLTTTKENVNGNFSQYSYIGRQGRIDKFLCTGDFYDGFINSGGGTVFGEKDIIENCGKVIISPNTNIKGGEGNYTFYIETKGYRNRRMHSEIDVEGTGTVIFPEINLFSDCDEVTYSSDDNILSLKMKLARGSQYILDIKNYYIEQGSGKPNFILIDKGGNNIVPTVEKLESSTVKINSFELHTEYPLNNFDAVKNHYREIINNNDKGYKVFGIVRGKVQNQDNSTVLRMMFGSLGNDIINLDQGAVFAKGGNGSDIYVIDSGMGEREVIIDNNADDKKLDTLLVSEVPEEFSIQQRNLYLNCDGTHIQVKNYLQGNSYKHLMVMNSKGETFIPYAQSIFDGFSVDNGELVHGELVPFIHATQTQSEFFLHKDFEYDHVVIDSRFENIERYRDKDDILLMRESEVPFIIKVEGYYDGSSRWESVNFLLWNNGNFSYFDLPQEIDEVISYQDKLKDDYKEITEEYIIDFSRFINITHNQGNALTSVDQDKERIGVIRLKDVLPDRVKVSSSDSDLVLRDIESNYTVNIKNWDSSESHRISTLEFDLGLDSVVIRRLNRFSLSNVVEIQTLINKASENYQNGAGGTETEYGFKCLISVNGFESGNKTYECLGFSSLEEQINFTENFCSLEQINEFKDKIPGHNKILQLLRNVKNDFALKGYEQSTVSKCSEIFTEIVKLLVNKKDKNGYTQLHYASGQMDNLYELEFLIDNGANINAVNIFGDTPLHIAAIGGKLNVVKFLVNKSADISIENNHGRTPSKEAEIHSNSEIAGFLNEKQNEYNSLSSESADYVHQAISDQGVAEPHYAAARISDDNEEELKTSWESVSNYLRWPVSLALGVGVGLVGLVGGYFGYRNRMRGRANLAPVAAAIPLLTLGNTANAKSTEFRTKRAEQRLSESSESIQTAAIGGTNPGQSTGKVYSVSNSTAKVSKHFYESPTLECPNNPHYSETNQYIELEYNAHMVNNIYLMKCLFSMFGKHAVVSRMNQLEQILANNHASMSQIDWIKKQLKQGIATYGSQEEKAAEQNKVATSSAATFAEKWMDRKNTTPRFFALPTSQSSVANASSFERPLIKR